MAPTKVKTVHPITESQARTIYDLSGGTFPTIFHDSDYSGYALRHNNVVYTGDSPSDLESAARTLIADLLSVTGSTTAFSVVFAEAAEAAEEEAARAEVEARLDEEANRTPLEWAEIYWADVLDATSDINELVMTSGYVASLLVYNASDAELEDALHFIQKEIVDTLLESDDLPLYEGALLAVVADIIELALG